VAVTDSNAACVWYVMSHGADVYPVDQALCQRPVETPQRKLHTIWIQNLVEWSLSISSPHQNPVCLFLVPNIARKGETGNAY